MTEEPHDTEKLSDELQEVMKKLVAFLNSKVEEEKAGYWTIICRKINKAFFIVYLIAIVVFLVYMFLSWTA